MLSQNCILIFNFLFSFSIQDVPLFEGIISDLFPGTKWPNPDYGSLMTALVDNCKKNGLQATDWFLKKIIQVCGKISVGRPEKDSDLQYLVYSNHGCEGT